MAKKKPKTPNTEHVLVRWNKSDTKQMRILVSHYKDHDYIHIREYWRQTDGDEWKPGKGAVLWKTELPHLFRAVRKLAKRYEADEEVQEAIAREAEDRAAAQDEKEKSSLKKSAKALKRVKART